MIVSATNIFTASGGFCSTDTTPVLAIDMLGFLLQNPKPHKNVKFFLKRGVRAGNPSRVFLATHSCAHAYFKPSISFAPSLTLCTVAFGHHRKGVFYT